MSSRPSPRRTPLTVARVIDAAVSLADAEGIDALTVRRLADVLGVHPTSLYNHVASKEALLGGVIDRLFEEASLPDRVDGWEQWVTSLAEGLRRVAQAHPGAVLALTRVPSTGPRALAQTELALDAFRRAGFDVAEAAATVAATSLALLGLALNERPAPTDVLSLATPGVGSLPRVAEVLEDERSGGGRDHWALLVDVLIRGLRSRRRTARGR